GVRLRAPDPGGPGACGARDSVSPDGRLCPPRLARRGCRDTDRTRRARHRALREGCERAEVDARVRTAREDLMAIRIRTTRNAAEYQAAVGSIGHYFGGTWSSEDAERFRRL